MNKTRIVYSPAALGAAGAAAVLFAGVELAWGSGGSLLLALTVWTCIAEGCVALIAAAEMCNARWTEPVKRRLLSVYPLIALMAPLFLLTSFRIDTYPWAGGENAWLNRNFFLGRNVVWLLLTFASAHLFAADSIAGNARRKRSAVVYLLLFAVSQSLVAFDWIMSLEYPWFSTLFGLYFGVESLYAAIALAALYIIMRSGQLPKKTLQDVATVLFGFSLFWAGLFYAQFLVIWYGNLPEEAGYVFRRVYEAPWAPFAKAVLALLFVLPFAILASRRTKRIAPVVVLVTLMVFAGLVIEKIILIDPAAPIAVLPAVLQLLLLGGAFAALVRSAPSE